MAFSKKFKLSSIVESSKLEDSSFTSGSKTPPTPPADPRPPPIEIDKLETSRWSAGSETSRTPYEYATPPSPPPALVEARPKSWSWHFISLFLSFLWLPFTITLLVLNFTSHVIGASVWCPFGRCSSDAFSDHAIATAVRLDQDDHDMEAGLQYVAQAFEIWFLIIATNLLYDVVMLFARSSQGMPVGFMLTHLEFDNPKNLANPLLWTSAFRGKPATRKERKRSHTIKLFLFALLAALITVLVNLMGAATAVLLIPSLSWVSTPKFPQQRFESIALAPGPIGDTVFPGICDNNQLIAGNYSCTTSVYGPSLDEWAAIAQSSLQQLSQPNGGAILGTSQEAAVQFALNASSDSQQIWIANRQVLRDVSGDYLEATGQGWNKTNVAGDTEDDTPDPRFTKSLQTILQRTGPALGMQPNCFVGNFSETTVAAGKEIHCYSNWAQGSGRNYTKCFRIGVAFNSVNKRSTFYLASPQNSSLTPISSSFSDLATFYNPTADFDSGIERCLSNTTAPTCDWDKIFSTPLPPDLANSSENVGITSYSIPSDPTSQSRIWCEATAYLSFPTYSMDTSRSSNELQLVQLDNFEQSRPSTNGSALVVNPDWFLAAWSVDRDGIVDGTRPIARDLRTALDAFRYAENEVNALQFLFYHIYALGQGMSMVNYVSSPLSPSSAQHPIDPDHPVFATWAQIHVWAWGLQARTSILGVVIAIAGCVVVIARIVLGLCMPRRGHSPVELFAAALEYRAEREGAFGGLQRDRDVGRVGFQVRDGEGVEGRLGFVPMGREVGEGSESGVHVSAVSGRI